MFVGVSKNVGNGFRIGVGTKLGGGSKKPSAKQLNTQEFKEFLGQVENDLNNFLLVFINANGKSYKELVKSKADLDDVFNGNENYQEFITLYNKTKRDIEKVLYSGDSGVVAKRSITDSVYELKDYIDNKYPNFVPTEKIKKPMNKVLKYFLITFGVLFLIGLLGGNNKNQNTTEPTLKNIETTTQK